jgi:hypothetical protein
MPEHLDILDFYTLFLKFFMLPCVLYGRIARPKQQAFAGELVGMLKRFRVLNLEF